jgi:hypothetical protein
VATLLLVRLYGIIHIGIVPHALSANTGGVVHSTREPCPQEHDGCPPLRESSEEDCLVFAVLNLASNVSAPLPLAVVAAELPVQLPAFREGAPATSQWALYFLAPSRPPPTRQG